MKLESLRKERHDWIWRTAELDVGQFDFGYRCLLDLAKISVFVVSLVLVDPLIFSFWEEGVVKGGGLLCWVRCETGRGGEGVGPEG